jgi:carbon-monoxide dehydrogenase large subunit
MEVSRASRSNVTIFTPDEVNSHCKPIPIVWYAEGMRMATQPILADERVRFVGEPLACVIATDRYRARDALELIDVDLDPLPAVVDIEAAMEKDSVRVHDEYSDNIGLTHRIKHGDVDAAFREAEVVIKEKFRMGRVAPVAMEARGVLSRYDPASGTLIVTSSTQIPFMLRQVLSEVLDFPENRIRVISPDIGGGFGSKDGIYPEEVLTSFASMKLGRPVKWVEERSENLMATNHDREEVQYVEVAAGRDGRVAGLRAKILINAGAYYRFKGARMVFLVPYMLSGQYRIPCIEAEAYSIFTNTTPTFPYRGPGMCEATFLIERVMDIVAQETGLDPAEVRLRNLIHSDEFPYTTATGATYDSGDYSECLQRTLKMSEYYQFRREQAAAREKGRYLGIGIGCFVEQAGIGPTRLISSLGIGQGGWEKATVVVDRSGNVTVISGIQAIGQGTETAISEIVGRELDLSPADVTVLFGDTALTSYAGGAFASRSLSIGGSAASLAARKVKEKIMRVAAHLLEARDEDLVYKGGRVSVKGFPSRSVTVKEVAVNCYDRANLPEGMEPGLEASATFDPPNFTFSSGAMVAKVEVDAATGIVSLNSFYVVHDCGIVINSDLVDGQLRGGITQGIGEALLEEIVYDNDGQLLSGTLADYNIPSTCETPHLTVAHIQTSSPVNPLGAKGVGESGTIGSPAAIANAVADALQPLGGRITQLPLNPEYLWKLIRKHRNF